MIEKLKLRVAHCETGRTLHLLQIQSAHANLERWIDLRRERCCFKQVS